MNDIYCFQNANGIGIDDVIYDSSNINYKYTSNSSNYVFEYSSNSVYDITINTNDNVSNLSYELYDLNKHINPLPIIFKDETTGSTVLKISETEGEIKFDTATGNEVYTKIDKDGIFHVYHDLDVTLPTRSEGWWNVEGELTSLMRDGIGLRFDITENQALDAIQTTQIEANSGAITELALGLGALTLTTIPSIVANVAALELSKQDNISVDKPFNFEDNKISLRYDTSLILDDNQDRLRINSNLNITDSLLIGNSITNLSELHLHTDSTSKNQRIQITDGNTGTSLTDGFMITKFANNDCSIMNNEYGNLILGANGDEAIRIKPNGVIGIDNNIPNDLYKLDVNGNINIGNGFDLYRNGISFESTSNNLYSFTQGSSNNLIDYLDTTSNNLYLYTESSSNNLIDHIDYTSNNLFTSLYDINYDSSNDLITYNNTTLDNLKDNYKNGIYTKNFVQSESGRTHPYWADSRFEVENAIYVRNDFTIDGATGTRLELRGGMYLNPQSLYNYIILDANNDLSLHTCNQMRLTNFNTYITSKGNIETNSHNCYFNATTKLKINTPHILYNEIPAKLIINFYLPIGNNWTFNIPKSYYYTHLHIENYVPAKLLDTGEKVRVFKILAITEGDWDFHEHTYNGEYIGLKDELTIYMSNTIKNSQTGIPFITDDICNSRVYGKTKQSNFGYFLPFNTGETAFLHPDIDGFPFNNLYYATKERHKLYISITPLIYNYE